MRLRPTVTFEEYKATLAVIVEAKPKMGHKRSWQGYVLLALICLVFGLAAQFDATRIPVLTLLAASVLCWVFSKPLAKRSREKCFQRFYAEERARLNDQVLTIDKSGISCNQGNGQVVSQYTWQAFIYYADMPDAFLFLLSPTHSSVYPRSRLHHLNMI